MKKRDWRYWDACCFLGWLKAEEKQADACRGVIQLATKGELVLVTSAITLTEVIKLKRRAHIPKADAKLVRNFFKNDFIRLRSVDREIAELAQDLIWRHKFLHPKDSIHVATAIRHRLKVFDTFDQNLMKLSGKLGNPPIIINEPDIAYQADLFVDTDKDQTDEQDAAE